MSVRRGEVTYMKSKWPASILLLNENNVNLAGTGFKMAECIGFTS